MDNMDNEVIYNSLEEFMDALKKMGINKVAFSEVNERRAVQTREDFIEVIVVREVTVLSYKDSVVHKFSAKGDIVGSIYQTLLDNGFDIKRINKNIIQF
ncbi:MAG: hypothetical protein FWF73_02495 [Spirochaetes bacterium]|nr:hypothetical protein [Spirochaetota bacterium]